MFCGKESDGNGVRRELRFPPDSDKQYNPNGNCCELVVSTAYNTLVGSAVRVGDLVAMGYPSNRFGGVQMVELLNHSDNGPSKLHMESLELHASKGQVEQTFKGHLSRGELIYLVVYVREWWEHVLEGHGDIGNSRHAVLIHDFEQEGKKIVFHIYDPMQWKDQGKIRATLDQLWPALFLMRGFEGEMVRFMDIEKVECAVFSQ